MRQWLFRRAHRLDLRHDGPEHAERVGAAQRACGLGQRQENQQLVAYALGGHAPEPARRIAHASRRRGRQPQPQRRLEPHRAQRPQRVVGEHAGSGGPQTSRGQIGEATGGIDDRRAAPSEQRVEGDGERIDGEVARGEVGRERRSTKVRHVQRETTLDHHAGGAALGVEDDARAAHPLGTAARQRDGARRHGDVDVCRHATQDHVADGAAHHDRVAPRARLARRAQQRGLGRYQAVQSQLSHGPAAARRCRGRSCDARCRAARDPRPSGAPRRSRTGSAENQSRTESGPASG